MTHPLKTLNKWFRMTNSFALRPSSKMTSTSYRQSIRCITPKLLTQHSWRGCSRPLNLTMWAKPSPNHLSLGWTYLTSPRKVLLRSTWHLDMNLRLDLEEDKTLKSQLNWRKVWLLNNLRKIFIQILHERMQKPPLNLREKKKKGALVPSVWSAGQPSRSWKSRLSSNRWEIHSAAASESVLKYNLYRLTISRPLDSVLTMKTDYSPSLLIRQMQLFHSRWISGGKKLHRVKLKVRLSSKTWVKNRGKRELSSYGDSSDLW
jgi:hypothetical protein